ncbi:MAG: PaaI family thioesterase [Clostridia bacterium]|nr:PaaI family thioesterase [Clostridia bacterium]
MKVVKRQYNGRMCAVCGLDNVYGLRAPFYTMEDGSVVTLFTYRPEHQSYPGRVHGGLIASMLDELGLRGLWAKEGAEISWGVTTSIEVKYRKPVPYNEQLIGRGVVIKDTPHFFTVHSTISSKEGALLAEGTVNYLRLSVDKIVSADVDTHEELCYLIDDGVTEIEI